MHMLIRRAVALTGLPKLLPSKQRKDFTVMREHERHPCCALASMTIVEREVDLDGLVLEVSQGGLLFREASSFIFDRYGSAVKIRVAGLEVSGTIVNVRANGYGIRLTRQLTMEELDLIQAQADVPTAAAA
jgi:hypothetical protein